MTTLARTCRTFALALGFCAGSHVTLHGMTAAQWPLDGWLLLTLVLAVTSSWHVLTAAWGCLKAIAAYQPPRGLSPRPRVKMSEER